MQVFKNFSNAEANCFDSRGFVPNFTVAYPKKESPVLYRVSLQK